MIKSRDGNNLPPYQCCCCCNMFVSVVIIFLLEIFWLVGACIAMDVVGMTVSGVLVLLFLISFFAQGNLMARTALLYGYLGRAIAIVIVMVVYMFTSKIDDILVLFCDSLNEFVEYPECRMDLQGAFWGILLAYTVVVLLFRLLLTRVLYYYHLELKQILNGGEDEDAYQSNTELKETLVNPDEKRANDME